MSEEQKPLMGDFAEDSAPDPAAAQTEGKKKVGFSSKLGFVLAAAGSAVGLGNLWRFPYLAAKYGGGMFLLCYILLAVTFGGLVMLYRILQPFNGLRFITYALSVGISILVLAVPVLGELVYTGWTDVELTFTQILYIVCIVLAAFPVSKLLVKLCDLMNPLS